MGHILEYKEWQGASGNWYCNDVKGLCTLAGQWWVPARMLKMTIAEYAQWLLETYHPDNYTWNGKIFIYSWSKEHYSLCHKFVLDINRIARNKKFIC